MIELFKNVPLYNSVSIDRLRRYFFDANLPTDINVLNKKDLLRAVPGGFINDEIRLAIENGNIEYTTTSGSSGDKLTILRPNYWWRREFANGYASNPDMLSFNSLVSRKAVLTTAICSGNTCFLNDPSFDERKIDNTLYLNVTTDPNNWTKNDIIRISEELLLFCPALLEADPVYLCIFLLKRREYAIDIPLWHPQYLTCSYEYLSKGAKSLLEATFGLPVFNMYGSTELGVLYISDALCRYHRVPHETVLEFVDFETTRRLYKLVVTSWRNRYMPYLRYSTDDVVEVDEATHMAIQQGKSRFTFEDEAVITAFHGRAKDIVVGRNKRIVTVKDIDDYIWNIAQVFIGYQIQRDGHHISFIYVIESVPDYIRFREQIVEMLHEFYGHEYQFEVRPVQYIPTDASGKFSLVKNAVRTITNEGRNVDEQLAV